VAQPDPEHQAAQIAALVAAQAAARRALVVQARAFATTTTRSFRGWYDTDAITEWAAALAARIEVLQRTQAQTTDAYLARALSMITGRSVRPIGRVDVSGLRSGVTHAGAYGRTTDQYRWRQSQVDTVARKLAAADIHSGRPLLSGVELLPTDLNDPIDTAVDRAVTVADLDLQLADRAQSHLVLTSQAEKLEITGQRRVIHPELSKGGTCGLCIASSGRLYGVHELRPIHARCECTTLPVFGAKHDPGAVLNNSDLGQLYTDAGSTSAEDLKKTRYRINEHGELGPVLSKDEAFRSSKQARRDARDTDAPIGRNPTRLRKLQQAEELAAERARELAKTDPAWQPLADQFAKRAADLGTQLAA
jgi:hypothetical protein